MSDGSPELGTELPEASPVGAGRRPVDPAVKRSRRLTVYLTPAEYRALEARAGASGLSVSTYVAFLIDKDGGRTHERR